MSFISVLFDLILDKNELPLGLSRNSIVEFGSNVIPDDLSRYEQGRKNNREPLIHYDL